MQQYNICSFCGKNADEFDLIFVKGYKSNICSECIKKAFDAIKKNEKPGNTEYSFKELPKPKEIKEF